MSARLFDAHGDEVPVRVMRRRMGFMGGDLLPDDDKQNDPPTLHDADREVRPRMIGNTTHEEESL